MHLTKFYIKIVTIQCIINHSELQLAINNETIWRAMLSMLRFGKLKAKTFWNCRLVWF